ncbi:NUDIX domain-containing protein [Phycicoccus sp. DTK01]|uniref:NUDIX hydrolase n=1 Tax=Phycicoccus sp. DTK01 TaxID=2785745 RepID=UPI001AA80B75|nr:NUDIX domain-containing protein [Phycicoccus sp. DTK01]GIL35222.1 NUDIX hydrolase [Phycicoccus sp. DTK01]
MTEPTVLRRPVRDAGLLERARAWVEAGSGDGPEPRPAATVMLVRDTDAGPEVYVQRRVATMAFAPSMVVFPGGRVDPADAGLDPATPGLADLAAHLGVTPAEAAPFAAAAVREVEEECGVRVEVAALRGRGHWVTPAFEPRRYDTWILAAGMPEGQEARETSGESDGGGWARASVLLQRAGRGEVRMMPPQVWALEALERFDSAAAFLADRPDIRRVVPVLEQDPDGTLVLVTAL